ncbi:PDZ domain-containing protein [candidate division KSB1 bacterium]|nr:PDZ domain-containing protein [candidate division KSB1 bacterium]
MKRVFAVTTLMIVIAITAIAAKAQTFVSRSDSTAVNIVGEPFNLGELGAVVVDDGKEIKFLHVAPADMRPKAYKDLDVQAGDVVLMCNGKRLKTLKELEAAYNETAVGAEFKMGVRRKEERFIVSFAKADPKDLPKIKMQLATTGGPASGGGGVKMQRFTFGGPGQDAGDIAPLLGLGLIIGKKENVFKVVGVMQNVASADFKQDDIIESFNGEKIKSTQQLSEMYEKLAVGAKIELQYKRGDKTMQASLIKKESQGRMMIRNNNQ